jgi:3-methyladenine DNA glycosylase AlkD
MRKSSHQKSPDEETKCQDVLEELRAFSNPQAVKSMARFGINPKRTLGIPIPALRGLAREIGRSHSLALQLWATGIHEARILASMIDEPEKVTDEQMEAWVEDFDSWDVCDQCCMNLFEKTGLAYQKCVEWSSRKDEFVKRAGFALMARLAVSDREAGDNVFIEFLPIIKRESVDERNYVKKAVSWALRQIGKRNRELNRAAIKAAEEIRAIEARSARWIASDALRELTSDKVQGRLK